MSKAVLEEFGITKDDVLSRVVESISRDMLSQTVAGEDDETYDKPTQFQKRCEAAVMAKIDEAVTNLAAKNVLPNIEAYLESLVLNQTNKWGEKTGAPVTFIEYLTQRAETYMTEDVNFEGKSKAENGSWGNWNKAGTRVALMMDKHIQYSINIAIANALKDMNSRVAVGIAETVKAQLADVLAKLKVEVRK